jgi:hypothetical protein
MQHATCNMRIPLKRLHANSAASDHTGQVRYCKSAFGRRCTARCEPDGARNSVATVGLQTIR